MSTSPDRRTRKRQATRQSISDAATRLFIERGFDSVTVDEIAEAADVGRMTVFNHFARKEDMFFDLDLEGREDLRDALRNRDLDVAPIEALRLFAHRIVAEQRPYTRIVDGSRAFMDTIANSETLKARARAIRDELTTIIQEGLAARVGRDPDDSDAHLAASLILATWTASLIQAYQTFCRTGDGERAQEVFLAVVDRGMKGVKAAAVGMPYA